MVFLGPSLSPAQAAEVLDAEYLPPVQRGDIDALLRRPEPPEVIGIVDGKFLSSLSISPKEVLNAVDRGTRVYGSSSMGALRAAECAPWGMVGIGRIFEAYATGAVDADDEVAIVFDEESGAAFSDPMVNLRFAIEAATERQVISPDSAEVFLTAAKGLYFPERTVRNTLRVIIGEVSPAEHEALTRFFADGAPDTKADDARLLLTAIREYLDRAAANPAASAA
ncbi:TfuA-like protein [Streptomyces sp. AC550_RSS872]|uniref:TfuA-like protein n=1 Tax=Streptomyces sp. AC550_RSS872 TaxID=2823689 RepID=UPI0027E550D8|nr:TfuA-like protein [Streptomyces sp. AC550_RSS872]